jgi:dienelactone hydrolase
VDRTADRRALAAFMRYPIGGVPLGSLVRRDEERQDGFILERLAFAGDSEEIPALLVRPPDPGRYPAILYCHAHGGRYEVGMRELVEGRPSLLTPYGPLLARAGYVTLCVEMPAFGERRAPSESARAKERLWRGDTLFGAMLRDLGQGLAYLRTREEVDPGRIGAFGLSMGATHAFWMAALDEGIGRVAHLCSYADIETLIALGNHDLHGHYMTVPGLLDHFSTGRICGLVAPRPQLIGVGYRDPLTPKAAVDLALAQTLAAYAELRAQQNLVCVADDDAGHVETPALREAVMRFFGAMAQ